MKWICYYWEINVPDSYRPEQYMQWSLAHKSGKELIFFYLNQKYVEEYDGNREVE
jgi:hypothetical protein